MKEYEMQETGQDKQMRAKVGVYVCECGPNIAGKVDLDKILADLSQLDDYQDVELVVKKYGFLCSGPGKEFLEEEIKSNGFTHLVIGACSPRDHDSTFMGVCEKTDLNPYLYKIINIREHCTWVIDDKEKATEKAFSYIRGGIARVLRQSELFEKPLDINPDVLVIGGGISGMEAALSLSGEDRRVFLVEKTERLGGVSLDLSGLLPGQGDVLSGKIESIMEDRNIRLFLNTRVENVIGFLGNFEIELLSTENAETTEIMAGAIVVATGSKLFEPGSSDHCSYSESDEVYTSLSVEKMFSGEGEAKLRSGKQPSSVALIHCVGREEKNYCSGICCSYMMKLAGYFKNQSTDIQVSEFYRDICLTKKDDQERYAEACAAGVAFIRIKDISIKGTDVSFEKMNGEKGEQSFDMVVLAPALEPSADTEALSDLLTVPLDESGFFQEAHNMTNPIGTSTDGVFIVGTAHGPKGVSDSMQFARASAGQILTRLIPGEKLIPEVKVTEILEAYCTGCGNCLDVCVYGAIYSDDSRGISVVNEAVCRGCGNCFGSCPSGALRTKHFTNTQLYREVDEALR
ncbi:MAG: FAD-dependent oxidoreductase [Candidatus Aegiribacteria sp.]|nr:FAD-dependent oxidoreductase [Candidatus Aegiribacteria sp.]